MKNKTIHLLTAAVLAVLLAACAAAGAGGGTSEQNPSAGGAASGSTAFLTALPGFEGLRLSAGADTDASAPYFCLTEDSASGILYGYIPAEMSGTLRLQLYEGERLFIEGTGRADGYQAGDILPTFKEGREYLFMIRDGEGKDLEKAKVIFHQTENVPSMYIETESGSMSAVDGDRNHETREDAIYRIYRTDGTPDSAGTCSIKGRGNSTWSQPKRPYNLNLDKKNRLLGMDKCKKYALIANYWDSTQTRQYYAFLTAQRLGLAYTPQTQFVNLYLNGHCQSLYLLTQRLSVNGGTVDIPNLDKLNRAANNTEKTEDDAWIPDSVVMEEDEKGYKASAYLWEKDPPDITGGYLLEMQNRYRKKEVWFSTQTRHFSIEAPESPSVNEYTYITEYVREAEKALYAEDWINPDTGLGCFDYFDMDSWVRMYLIQDYFVQSDDEFYSFFLYKNAGDPLLYCGPVWDFDLCLGSMNLGDYYKTSARTLWLKDGRKRWLHRMQQHPEFRSRVADMYLNEMEPILRRFLKEEYWRTVDLLETDTNLNYLRWHKNLNYRERTDAVFELMQTRTQFLHDYYTDPSQFYCHLFHFAWGDFSYYVRKGEALGFVPTAEYGENQSPSQKKDNGVIVAWKDTKSGGILKPDTVIDSDREYDPVYQ